VNSAHAKRMSTSIPTLSAIRRQSAPVQGIVNNSRSTSLLSSPVISTPARAMPTTQRNSATLKTSPSAAGSVRTARSSNNMRAVDSPPQNSAPIPPSTPRSRVLSMPTERSDSPGWSLSVSSPSINLTTPSPQSSRIKPSPQQSSPQTMHTKPSSRKSGAASQANRKSQNRQNGSAQSTISMSTPPRQLDFHQINGDEDFAGSMSIWDGDDMTLDMITEASDENVDEEVSTVHDVF
jgi:pyrimidine and pyridine-specific 5'-nucleotidase